MTSIDDQEWVRQVSRRIDEAKCSLTSNSRLPDMALAKLASDLEGIKKAARALLDGGGA